MRRNWKKGLMVGMAALMLTGGPLGMLPGSEMVVEAATTTFTDNAARDTFVDNTQKLILKDYEAYLDVDQNADLKTKLDQMIADAITKMKTMDTKESIEAYTEKTKAKMLAAVTPAPKDDDDDEEEEEVKLPDHPDHFLVVGDQWVAQTVNPGQNVRLILPVINMGVHMVKNATITPKLSTNVQEWPFEITNGNYAQRITDLPGTETGASDADRRREIAWDLKARSDIGKGYQKITFEVKYQDVTGASQSAELEAYLNLNGSAGVSADGHSSVPRVIVTGFETDPETVHAGESFMLTLHLKNTSIATSVSNMIFEITAAVEGKDADTTYAAFLPTAGSSTIFVDKIGKNGTKDLQIEMEARADLVQKPYVVDVNMSYEDEHVNAYTNKSSVSIPVKQEARVDTGSVEVMPDNISVGNESNVMFSIYNMGKTKLYNVQVKTENPSVSGSAFIGNLESGATGNVDMYLVGQAATENDGTVVLQISYEDETGEATVIEKEITLFVNEEFIDMGMNEFPDEGMMMEEPQGGSGVRIAIIIVVALAIAGGGAAVFFLRRKKKKMQQKLEEELLDLDDDDTEI